MHESPFVAGDPRTVAGAFALVLVAEGAAQALGVVYPSVLAAVPDWRGASLVVGAVLAFGVGVGGTSALYARWTRLDVRFGPPAARPLALPVLGAALAGLVVSATRGGPSFSAPSALLNVAVGPALVAAVGYGLLYAVVAERTRVATETGRTPWLVALAGAVVVAVPLRLPLSAPLVSEVTLAFVATGALVVGVGAAAARLTRPAVGGLALGVVGAGAAAGVAFVPALSGVVAVGLAAVAYERTRTVLASVAVLAAFRVVAAV